MAALLSPAHSATVYVDASAEADGDGSQEKPFPAIQQAASVLKAGDVCLIRKGTYRETVVPAFSGTKEAPIVFRACEDERVIITGCDQIQNWKQEKGDVYYCEVKMDLGHENQVFADGKMLWEARWPNVPGWGAKQLLEFPKASMDKDTSPTRIVDEDLPEKDWTGATAWITSHKRWYCWTGKVTGHGKGFITLQNNSDKKGNHVCKKGGQYYLFGTKVALDVENEWFYDKASRRLYAWAPGGGDPGQRIEVKRRPWAFDLKGKTHVTIRNVTLTGASIVTDEESESLRLEGLRVYHPYHSCKAERQYGSQGNTGIVLRGRGHVVRNCEIAYSSGNGLYLAGRDCRIVNNYIHDCNYMGTYAAPLTFAKGTSGHLISHNTILRAGRSSINTSGLYDCLVQYNDIGFTGYLTYDLGLTYGNGVEGGGSELRYNWFHDNLSPHICFGIYFDHGCRNLLIHHNAIWNVRDAGIVNNQYANYLLYYHNTIADSKYSYQSAWAAAQKKDLYGCFLVNNLGPTGTRIKGEGLTEARNLWGYKSLSEKKYPTAGTAAVDKARTIKGINDGFKGAAPDCGAYELGGVHWRAGHDFKNPPLNIDTKRSLSPHRNLLANPAWFRGSLEGWETQGGKIRVIAERHSQWVTDGRVVMGGHSVEFGAGRNAIRQTVTGLTPNTTYELMGMFRADKGAQGCIGIERDGGAAKRSPPVSGNAPHWERRTLQFTTGPKETRVVVLAEKSSTGNGLVYVDDMGLQIREKAKDAAGQRKQGAKDDK